MSRAAPLPDGLPPAFSVSAARASGVPRSRLRASDLVAPFRGSRMSRPDALPSDRFERARVLLLARCTGYVPVAPTGFRFSHVTAALLYGMPLPDRLVLAGVQETLDVAVTPGTQPPRGRGIRGHRVADTGFRLVAGFPVVVPELAWLQLAPQLTADELVIAGDHLVRRKRAASSDAALRAIVERPGARGVIAARMALGEMRSGTDSPRETAVRLIIVRAGLPEPVIGYRVHHDGSFIGTPDLAYVRERIAIEYEGEPHWRDPRVFREDIERRELFERAGWRVFRVTNDHIVFPTRLVSRLSELLRERTPR